MFIFCHFLDYHSFAEDKVVNIFCNGVTMYEIVLCFMNIILEKLRQAVVLNFFHFFHSSIEKVLKKYGK